MESQCLICRRSVELKIEDIQILVAKNKVLLDSSLSLFKIEETSYNTAYKWKWDSQNDFPNFCDTCTKTIGILSELEKSINIIKKNIQNALVRIQIIMLKSTSYEKRNFYKIEPTVFLSESVSVIDKIYYFRSIAIQDWLPVIFLKRCDEEKETDEIVDLNSKDEEDQFFLNKEGNFQCNLCSNISKYKRNLNRHINDTHRRIKRFRCMYSPKTYYTRSNCKIHIKNSHRQLKFPPSNSIDSTSNSSNEKNKCVLCYKSFGDGLIQIPPKVFSSVLNIHCLTSWKIIFKSLADSPISCIPCSNYFADLHNLRLELGQMENTFDKLLLKTKADILLCISTYNRVSRMKEESQWASEKISWDEKMEYFGRLVVKELTPVISLFKMEIDPNYYGPYLNTNSHRHHSKLHIQRTPAENSIFKSVRDGEIIKIKSDAGNRIIPLTDDEQQYYFNNQGETFTCRLCGSFSSSYSGAVSHCNKFHKQIKRFQCKYCAKPFYYRHDCAFHVVSCHKMERVNISVKIENRSKLQSDSIATPDGVIELPSKSNMRLSKDDVIKMKNNLYKCAICSKVYSQRNTALNHQRRIHLSSYRFKCEFCHFKNHHKYRILYHIRMVHPDKQKLIEDKNISMPSQIPSFILKKLSKRKKKRIVDPSLVRGMKVLETKTIPKIEEYITVIGYRYSCKTCGREFTSRYNVLDHIQSVHFGVRRYQCGVCTMKYYQLTGCKKHMQRCHPDYLDSLDKEESSFAENCEEMKPSLNDNLSDQKDVFDGFPRIVGVKHQGEKMMQVESHLKLELEINSGSPECSMDIGEPFAYKTEDNEKLDDQDVSDKYTDYECANAEIISNEPSENTEREVGLNSTDEVPRKKRFLYTLIQPGDILELQRGPNYDENQKKGLEEVAGQYKCVKCNKIFKQQRVFEQHWGTVHDTSGGYQCSVCQKRYYYQFHCAQHFLCKHTDRNPYVCHICDRTCPSNSDLQFHVKRHMGERPFSCSECPLKFISERTRKNHYENVHMKILGP